MECLLLEGRHCGALQQCGSVVALRDGVLLLHTRFGSGSALGSERLPLEGRYWCRAAAQWWPSRCVPAWFVARAFFGQRSVLVGECLLPEGGHGAPLRSTAVCVALHGWCVASTHAFLGSCGALLVRPAPAT